MRIRSGAAATVWTAVVVMPASAGDLTPPVGPVAETHKTLTEVEPRTPVQSLPGDAAAAYIIAQPGSYYLTGNVNVPAGMNGIRVEVPGVTIDLCGFTLSSAGGVATNGVTDQFPAERTCVHGGTISGWTSGGLTLGASARVHDVTISGCASIGAIVGNHSLVEDCVATGNGIGIYIADGCTVLRCVANSNTQVGFATSGGNVLFEECQASFNAFSGLTQNCCSGLVIRNSVFNRNGTHGLDLCAENFIIGNECAGNGTTSTTGTGIVSRCGGNHIEGNMIYNNDRGIDLSPSSKEVVIRNSLKDNTGGAILDSTGNDVGPTSTAAAATSPWANISN